MDSLGTHDIRIAQGDLVLRPMTEADWPLVEAWNGDPEVVYFAEGDEVERRLPGEVRAMYRHISRRALMFIIEVGGRGVGEPIRVAGYSVYEVHADPGPKGRQCSYDMVAWQAEYRPHRGQDPCRTAPFAT